MNKARFAVLAVIVLLTALTRVLPHPESFAPVTAVALFGFVMFRSRLASVAVPVLAMIASDVILFSTRHADSTWQQVTSQGKIYLMIVASAWLGSLILRQHRTPLRVVGGALIAAVLFFLASNCVWLYNESLYPHTCQGQYESYVAGLPYFRMSALADVMYSCGLFGGFALAERRFTWLAGPWHAAPATATA